MDDLWPVGDETQQIPLLGTGALGQGKCHRLDELGYARVKAVGGYFGYRNAFAAEAHRPRRESVRLRAGELGAAGHRDAFNHWRVF